MVINQGILDRAVRVVAGIVLLALVFVGPRTLVGLVGIIPLATGIVGFCPLYRLVGLSTCRMEQRQRT